jgi:hypothetical protein
MIHTDGAVISLGDISQQVVLDSLAHAKAANQDFTGLMFKMVMSPFPIKAFGIIRALVTIDGTEYEGATLRIVQSATASEPPASQSPPAAPST